MTLTITLPDRLVEQLPRKAEASQRTTEEIAIDLLEEALEAEFWPTLEEVVAKIKATPPDLTAIRPAEGSLADHLRQLTPDPDFDLETWERAWEAVEEEMRTMQCPHSRDRLTL